MTLFSSDGVGCVKTKEIADEDARPNGLVSWHLCVASGLTLLRAHYKT